MTYGERLLQAMDKAGIDRKTLAARLGVSKAAVGQVILGSTKMFDAVNHTKACQALGVSPAWLAIGEGEMTSAESPGSASSTWPLERLRESTWRSLTERQKALLEDVMMAKLRELQAEEAQVDPVGLRRKQRSSGTQ